MVNVVIVDDEQLMRTKLISLIEWEKHGFSLCGVFSSGEKAIRFFEKNTPDIILSDVKMPGMDGLELSNQCQILCPNSIFIAMSSFDDFKYVKGILQNGALDYLLKHTLNADTLLDVLNRAAKALSSMKKKVIAYSSNNLLALKQQFIIKLISSFYQQRNDIQQEIESLELPLGYKNAICILLAVDDFHNISSEGIENISLYKGAIVNIVDEILSDMDNGVACHYERERYILLLTFENKISEGEIQFKLEALLKRIQYCLQQFLNLSVSFSVGCVCNTLLEISKSFLIAQNNLEKKLYKGKNCIISADDYKNALEVTIIGLDIEKERLLISYLKSPCEQQLLSFIDDIFAVLVKNNSPISNCQMIFNNLLSIISRICREESLNSEEIFESSEMIHVILERLETIEEIHSWFLTSFKKLHTAITNTASSADYSDIVKNTILYLKQNFEKDISLSQAAKEINVSSVYLSKIFKKETSLGFNDYLNNLRLDKSKFLILQNKHSLKQISNLCGFNNYTYFFSVFKQKEGCTPKEFYQKESR